MEGVGWVGTIGNVGFIRDTMLDSIHQLRLHVIISTIIADGGSPDGLEMAFHPQVVIQVWATLYAEGLVSKKELPWAAFSPYDLLRLSEVPTCDQRLILLIFLADRSIPPPDHKGSGVVCVDQRRK